MRKIPLLILVLVIVIPVVALSVILVPAHRQIGRVDPPLPKVEDLLAAVNVDNGPIRVRYVNSATQPSGQGRDMGHVAFVLDWADGRKFMIDLGMEPVDAIAFGKPMETLLGSDAVIPHGAVADQIGSEVMSVEGLAFTHLHHDHTQGIVALCRARKSALSIFQTPFQFEQRNHTTDMGYAFIEEALGLPGTKDCGKPERLEESAVTSVHALPGFPGLVAIPAGGHTPGSTLYLARIGDRHWLFSGDITNTRQELDENLPKAAVYSLLIVPENTDRTERMRLWLRDIDARPDLTVVVSHDLTALEGTDISAW